MKFYPVKPMAKPRPRVTRNGVFIGDKAGGPWKAYKQHLSLLKLTIPSPALILIFDIPMPKSWTKKHKAEMLGYVHEQTPDKDNLEKGVLDVALANDAKIFAGIQLKRWVETGGGGIWVGDIRNKSDRQKVLKMILDCCDAWETREKAARGPEQVA